MRTIVIFGAALLVASTPAVAQNTGSRETRDYVQAAGQSDAFEMLEAETALTQSKDPQLLSFARQMLQDHGKTSRALQDATTRSGLAPPPMSVGADQAPMLGALQSLRGADFDRAYWHQQMLAHSSALTTTQHYAQTGDNPAVRQAAAAAVPLIAAHLAMTKQMVEQSGGS